MKLLFLLPFSSFHILTSGLWNQTSWTQILAVLFDSCALLGNLASLHLDLLICKLIIKLFFS